MIPSSLTQRLDGGARAKRRPPYRTGAGLDRFIRRLVRWFDKNSPTTFNAAAKHFDISPWYAWKLLREAGCKSPYAARGGRPPAVGRCSKIPADRIVRTFEELGTVAKTAARLGLGKRWVTEVLKRAGSGIRASYREVDWTEATRLYVDEEQAMRVIAKQFKVTEKRIHRGLVKRGVTIRPNTAHFKAWHAERKRKLDEVDALRLQVETGKAAEEKIKKLEAGGRMIVNKLGPVPDIERAEMVCRLYDRGMKWAAIKERVEAQFQTHTTLDALQELRKRHLARQKKPTN